MKAQSIKEINFTLELLKPANLWIRRINKEHQQIMAGAGV
jgi:hypothetical protein